MKYSSDQSRPRHAAAARRVKAIVGGVVVLGLGLWAYSLAGGGGQVVTVGAPGSSDDDGAESGPVGGGEDGSDSALDGDGRETVVVELPSALPDQPSQWVEVALAGPEDTGGFRDGAIGLSEGPVRVEELLGVEDLWWLDGELLEVEGRVQRKSPVGFWLVPADEVSGDGMFVVWNDANRGLPNGQTVVVTGVLSLAVGDDEQLARAGVEPDTAYLHGFGWQR